MPKQFLSAPVFAGSIVALLGVVLASRWLLQSEALTRLIPGSQYIGIVGPVLFISSAVCFLGMAGGSSSVSKSSPWSAAKALATALLLFFPLGHLLESAFDVSLGIDFAREGTTASALYPHPGRLSPNASIAFLLTGLAFLLLRGGLDAARRAGFLVATLGVALVGMAGLAGHFLGLETLYKLADYNRLQPVTALGLVVVSCGLWALYERSRPFSVEGTRQRIQRRTIAAISLVALSCGVAGFAVMRDTFEQSLSRNMLLTATTNATSLASAIESALWMPRSVATRPAITQSLERLGAHPEDAAVRLFLRRVGESLIKPDVLSADFYDLQHRPVLGVGTPARAQAQVRHALNLRGRKATLVWAGRYVLVTEDEVADDDRVVGRVVIEQALPLIDRLLDDMRSASETSDAALCSREGDVAVCAQTRLRQPNFELPLVAAQGIAGAAIVKALRGEQGVMFAKDPRSMDVLAAYAPVKDLGLALGVKTDVQTLYAPLRRRLTALIAAMAGIVALATYALRALVHPVLVQLVESERKTKSILEEQSELVSLAKGDGELVYVNPAYAHHFGLQPAQMIGASLYRHVDPADVDGVKATIAAVFSTGGTVKSENRNVRHDGQERWIAWTNSLQRTPQGELLLRSVGRDVTERRAAEAALRESRALLERTGRVAGVGGWQLDLRSDAVYWTEETRRIHEVDAGYAPTLHGALAFYAPHARPTMAASIAAATQHGHGWDLELPLITAKGREIWVRVQGQPEREDGTVVRLLGAIQDITDRKRLQDQLAANERFVRDITDHLPVRIGYVDGQARFRFVNEAYCKRFGRRREEILGHTRAELLADQEEPVGDGHMRGGLAGETRRFEYLEGRGADTRHVEVQLIPELDADARVRGVYITGVDITGLKRAERELRDLSEVLEHSPDFIVQTDYKGRVQYMNPAVRRALNFRATDRVEGLSFDDFNTPETTERYASEILPAVQREGVWLGETTVLLAGQKVTPVSHMVIAHRDAAGRISRYSAVMRDISQLVESRQALQRETAILQSVVEAIPAMVTVFDAQFRYRMANSAFERWLRRPRGFSVGRPVSELLGREEFERNRPWAERALKGETVSYERHDSKSRRHRHVSITFVPLRLPGGAIDGVVSVAQDVTEHRDEEQRLLNLAEHDALTGVLNRAGFTSLLRRKVESDAASATALLYIDLDRFKPVNDTYGHPVGDDLLRAFATRLQRLVRPSDAVARLGGDEFAIVLTGVRERASAELVADKVVRAAQLPFEVGNLVLGVGASVGLAFDARDAGSPEAFIKRADEALYRAKGAGRGRWA